jgi:ABC-type microcin C transport system permease subunit YejE
MSSSVETMSVSDGFTTPTERPALPPDGPPRAFPPQRRFRGFWATNDAHWVALISFLIGVVLSASLALAIVFNDRPQLFLHVSFLWLFHFLEYYVTAKYKPFEVTLDGDSSYLLVEINE